MLALCAQQRGVGLLVFLIGAGLGWGGTVSLAGAEQPEARWFVGIAGSVVAFVGLMLARRRMEWFVERDTLRIRKSGMFGWREQEQPATPQEVAVRVEVRGGAVDQTLHYHFLHVRWVLDLSLEFPTGANQLRLDEFRGEHRARAAGQRVAEFLQVPFVDRVGDTLSGTDPRKALHDGSISTPRVHDGTEGQFIRLRGLMSWSHCGLTALATLFSAGSAWGLLTADWAVDDPVFFGLALVFAVTAVALGIQLLSGVLGTQALHADAGGLRIQRRLFGLPLPWGRARLTADQLQGIRVQTRHAVLRGLAIVGPRRTWLVGRRQSRIALWGIHSWLRERLWPTAETRADHAVRPEADQNGIRSRSALEPERIPLP